MELPVSQVINAADVLMSESICQLAVAQQISVIRRMWLVVTLSGVGDVTFQDVATATDLWVASRLRACMCSEASYLGTRVRRNFPVGTDIWAVSTTSAGAGTGGTGACPPQSCALLGLLTDQIGKAGEGRIYLPFPPVTLLTVNGIWAAGMITAMVAVGGRFAGQQTVTGSGTKVAVLAPVLCKYHLDATTTITGFRTSTGVATQKRRSAYGRFNTPPF